MRAEGGTIEPNCLRWIWRNKIHCGVTGKKTKTGVTIRKAESREQGERPPDDDWSCFLFLPKSFGPTCLMGKDYLVIDQGRFAAAALGVADTLPAPSSHQVWPLHHWCRAKQAAVRSEHMLPFQVWMYFYTVPSHRSVSLLESSSDPGFALFVCRYRVSSV